MDYVNLPPPSAVAGVILGVCAEPGLEGGKLTRLGLVDFIKSDEVSSAFKRQDPKSLDDYYSKDHFI